MLKFTTRTLARAFAAKTGRKVIDLGKGSQGSRWAVKVIA